MFSVRTWRSLLAEHNILLKRCITSFRYSDLCVKLTDHQRALPTGDLSFGNVFTDHMLIVSWSQENGWSMPEIRPYESINFSPSIKVLHYATSCFEGFKAMRGRDNRCRIFRPDRHLERLRRSAERLCLPDFDSRELLKCIKRLIKVDEAWVPSKEGHSLYIRPFISGTDPTLGVDISSKAMLCVLLSPVGSYFSQGQKGVSLLADPRFVRAWEGGCGAFKLASNYAPTLYVQKFVKEKGCQTALWLYGPEEKLTEAGTMNIFLFWTNKNGEKELITPPLSGLILPGVTRESILELTRSWNSYPVCEKEITMSEVLRSIEENRLHAMFGTGTACVISPVAELVYKDKRYSVKSDVSGEEVIHRIYKELTDIQWAVDGPHPWTDPIDETS